MLRLVLTGGVRGVRGVRVRTVSACACASPAPTPNPSGTSRYFGTTTTNSSSSNSSSNNNNSNSSSSSGNSSIPMHPLIAPYPTAHVPIMGRVMSRFARSSMAAMLPPEFWTSEVLEAGAVDALGALMDDVPLAKWARRPDLFDEAFFEEVVVPGAAEEGSPGPMVGPSPLGGMVVPRAKVRAFGAAFGAADANGSHTNLWGLRMPTEAIGLYAEEHGYAPRTLAGAVEGAMSEFARFDVLVRVDAPVMLMSGGGGVPRFVTEGPDADFESFVKNSKGFGPFRFVSAKMPSGMGFRIRHELVFSVVLPDPEPRWVISDVNHTYGVFNSLLNSRMNTIQEPGAPLR